MQFVNLTDEQRKQIAAEQASKNIQPMPMEKGLQTEILPFSLNPLKLFGGVASNAAADVAGADRDYRADISNARSTDEIKSAVNNAISKFDNANPLIFGGDDLKKQKSEFLKNVSNSIRQSKLADGLSEYNGNLYLRKGDELFDLDDGLIKQIGRVMRDNVGSMAGAALGYKKGGGFLQNMAGSALGAAGGSGIDHLNNSNYAGQEANAANALKKMGEEALFSVAGDALIGAAAKYGKPTLNLAGKVADKMPLLNLGKQAVESVPTANVKGAMKSAEAIAGDEAEAMLKNAAEVGGYKVDDGNITDLQLLNPIINKAKDFSARAAQKLRLDDAAAAINNTRGLDAEREKILNLALSDRKSAERLLNALRGDKSGRGARNLADLAQSDVSRLREIIGQSETTDLKDVVEQYYKATKDDFGRAIDNLDAFKNGQRIKLSDDAIERMKEEYSSNLNIFDKSSDKTRGVMEGFDSLKGRELGVKELNELRANYNKGLNDILNSDKNSYATKINFIKGKEILERAMDDLLGDDAARAYLRENLQKYKDFKGFERSPLFKAITNIESSAQDVMNAFRGLRDTQGGLYDKFISKLSPEQAQKFELAAIKDDFEGALGKTGTFNVREILNGKELNDALKKTNFRSEKAKEIVREIDKLAKARGNLAEIFAALDSKFIMPTRFNKGIATTFEGASKTAFVNAVRQTALKYVPIIGNDAALEYHLREAAKAIKTGGTLNDYAKTMEKNGASKEQAKAFTDFIKEAAEQGSKLEQAEAKQEVVKGEGWTMRDGTAAKTDYNVKMSLAPNVRDLSKITTDEISADLEYLAGKHGEIFDKPSDVFKLIREIKNDPTHFFTNNRLDYALIVKRLKNNKIGKLAIDKQSGEARHATRVKDKDLKRLDRVSKEKSENAGIIQTFARPGSKLENRGLGYQDETIISQKGNLVNEAETNGLRDSVSSIGGLTANSNAHLGSGMVAGTLNSVDEDGNFSPERFAAGFLTGLVGSKAAAVGLRKMTPKLYNQILGIAEKMPQMANGNPRLLGKLYSNGKDVSLNSFAGEKAITANVGKLDQAKAMLEKGADEVEIWQKTGWFKDEIDDKWKFEINPRGGELKPNPPRNTVLYNVLNDEKLYEAYPELQLYKVELAGEYNPAALKALGSADGGFIPSQKTFIINEKTTDFKSTLYHEIQHAIQEIEGFSPGASSKNGKYWLAGGEVEARNVQKRMNDVSYDGFKNSTSMEFFPYKEEAQLQRMAGDKEYMEYHELSKKFDDYLNDKGDGLSAQEEARLGELYEKIKDRLGFTGDDYKKGYELYLKENAEYQKHPLHTLGAPRGERVNIGRGDLNLSRELERDFLSKDRINLNALSEEAAPLPKAISKNEFKAQFRVNDKGISLMYANPHVGAGLAGGTLNAKDENGNFDAEKFAKGFIYGLFGSKVTAATLKKTNPKLYDQIVNIGKDKAGKEKISSFVNKLKQDELGKLLQKTITNKDLSTKTKVEIIEAAKKRFAKESPKSLNGQSEAQMSESALKAKENNLKIDDVSNDAKEKWIKTFGLKSIDDDFIPNLKPEVKKAIKDKEIRLTKGSLLKIVARGREKYIPLIKQSLEDTDMVLKDEGTFLFVKEMDDKSLVFTSVGRNFDTHITIISNAPKKINNIKNKLMNKAEVVYRSSKLRTTPL